MSKLSWVKIISQSVALASISLPLCSCTNLLNRALTNTSTGTTVTAAPPVSTSTGTGTFTIKNVIEDTYNPASVLDVIGDGSGTLGTLCVTSNGANLCNCTLAFTQTSGAAQQVDTPVTYSESDMARCSYYNVVPSGITTAQVSIHLTSAGTYSNAITFKFPGVGNVLDTTSALSFHQIFRYQCRDIVFIPGILDGSVYDPIQSENFHLTYPLDYYAANLGNAISTYVQAVSASPNWLCPPILNPNLFLTPNALAAYNANYHINLGLFSKAGLAPSGSKVMYPPSSGVFDRTTFYLAKAASGVFTIPFDVQLAPTVVTAPSALPSPAPVGWGASPVVTGTTSESCPDASTVTIPTGYHWVKVWLFRASLSQRTYATPGTQGIGVKTVAAISCNPGDWANLSANAEGYGTVFGACDAARYDLKISDGTNTTAVVAPNINPYLGTALSISANSGMSNGDLDIPSETLALQANPIAPMNYLADRVLGGNNECIRLNSFPQTLPGNGSSGRKGYQPVGASANINQQAGANACGVDAGAACTGGDHWQAERPYSWNSWAAPSPTPTPPCTSDPMNTCTAITSAVMPQSNYMTLASLEAEIGQATGSVPVRYDFLFVVSPPSIMLSDMQNSTSAAMPYMPYRFYTDVDCLSDNPDAPTTPSDCALGNAITTYGLKLHDVGDNGDPPASDPARPGLFPICALQPDST